MKLRSLSVILLLQALPSLLFAASTDSSLNALISPGADGSVQFVASGVNTDDISSSDRFYDNGKGYYLQFRTLSDAGLQLRKETGGWNFLGNLSSRVPAGADRTGEFYVNLIDDANTCWYNADSNLIQYWQTYYGVFYRGVGDNGTDSTLPHGYNYDERYLTKLGGTHSLQVAMLFYDNWENVGGNARMSFSWYLSGNTLFNDLQDDAASAGFFRDYFDNRTSYVTKFRNSGLTMKEIRSVLIDGFGLEENADGSFTQSTVGQLIDFSLGSGGGGHALTCYGAEFDAEGNVTSVLIVNSDDRTYGARLLYLKSEDGRVYLYSDENCTQRWRYAAMEDWYVDSISYINTPDSLKRMYAQYTDDQNPLVWNGGSSIWDVDAEPANPDLLPTEATGWDVYVSEGEFSDYYHSWYDASRPLEFSDLGQGGEVSVRGNVSAVAVSFNSDTYGYSLKGEGKNTVTSTSLSITGKGGVSLSGLNFNASEASLSAGSLSLGSGAALTGDALGVDSGATLVLDGGSLGSDSVYFSSGSLLSVSSAGGSFTGELLSLGQGTTLTMDLSSAANATSALLRMDGRLNLVGSVSLNLGDQLEEGAVYRLIDFTNGTAPSNWESMFVDYLGTLEMKDNVLCLTNEGGVLYWMGGSGTWESANWALSEDGTQGLDFRPRTLVYFTGATAQETIEVQEDQQVRSLVFDGQYRLYSIGGSALDVLSSVELLENASVELGLDANLAQASVSLASGSSLKLWSSATVRLLENEGRLIQANGDLSITEALSIPGAVEVQSGNLRLGDRENSLGELQVSGRLSAEGQLGLTNAGASSSIGSVDADLSIRVVSGHHLTLGNGSSLRSVQGGDLSLGGSLVLAESSVVDNLNMGSAGALSLDNDAVISVSGTLSGNGSVTISRPHGVETPYLSAGSVSTGASLDFRGLSGSSALDGLSSGQKLVLATVSGANNGSFTFDGATSASGRDGEYLYNLVNEGSEVFILSHLNMVEWVGQSDDFWASAESWSDGSGAAEVPDSATDLSFQGAGDALVTLQQAQAREIVVEYVAEDKPEGYTWQGGQLEADSLSIHSGSITLAADASAALQNTQVSDGGALVILGRLDAGKTDATAVTLGSSGHLTIADGSSIGAVGIDPLSGSAASTLELAAGTATLGSARSGKLLLGPDASLNASELILTGSSTAAEGSITAGSMGSVAIGNSFASVTTAELVFGDLSETQEAFHIDNLIALNGQQIDVTLVDPSSFGLALGPGNGDVGSELSEGVYRLMTWTSGSADFRLSEQAESYLAGLMLTGTLEESSNSLSLKLDNLSGLTWYTSSDQIGYYTLKLSGEGAYNTLVPVSAVSVTRDNTLDLSSSDISTARAGDLGAVVRQMTGQSGRTLSFIGSSAGVDRVTFINDERSTTGAHRIAGRNITLQVGGSEDDFHQLIEAGLLQESSAPGNHSLTVGGVELENARLEVADAPGMSFTTGTLDGDETSIISGTIHINGAGGQFQGSADTLEGATIVLQSGADQGFGNGAGLVLTGSAGAASLAGDSLGALNTTEVDITLSPLGSAATPQPVELGAASSMTGGSLAAKVDTVGVFRGEGETAAIFSGASIELNGTRLILNSGGSATPSLAADVDLSKTNFVITQLHEQSLCSASGVSVSFGPGLLDKYFANATVQGNQVVASRNTSYYVKSASSSPNGGAGLALADGALVALNPQAETNRTTHPDLAGVLDSLDAAIAAGDRAGADRLGAIFAGAEAAGMGMAFSNDMDRQLRAIRNRTTTMGVSDEYVNPDMPYFNAWINAEGDYQQVKRDGTNPGYTLSSWGGTLGADVDFTPHFTAGLAVTAMYGDYQAESNGMAEGDLDSYYVTLFGRYSGNSAWVHTFVASVGMADASLKRTVTHANGSYTTEGDTTGVGFGLLYELGYTIALNEDATTCLQPVLNLSYVRTTLDGYCESGSDAALNYGDQTLDSFTVGLGARLQTLVGENVYNRTSMFESRALLKFTSGDRNSSMHTALASLPSTRATVKSEEQGAIGVELGAGLSVPLGADSGTLFIDASLEAYTSFTNVNATVGWRINF